MMPESLAGFCWNWFKYRLVPIDFMASVQNRKFGPRLRLSNSKSLSVSAKRGGRRIRHSARRHAVLPKKKSDKTMVLRVLRLWRSYEHKHPRMLEGSRTGKIDFKKLPSFALEVFVFLRPKPYMLYAVKKHVFGKASILAMREMLVGRGSARTQEQANAIIKADAGDLLEKLSVLNAAFSEHCEKHGLVDIKHDYNSVIMGLNSDLEQMELGI